MRGLERYDGAPLDKMRAATRQALEGLVELCLAEGVDLLLLAGDVFDGDWKDYATGLFFARQMSLLRQGGVRVVSIRGNHDAASQIQKHLVLPENVRELATRRPETVLFDDLGVAVHGQGFAKRAVTDDLAAGYPERVEGMVNIGLLHTCLTGRVGHERYAPTRLETLVDRGYDYWALGHVHSREVLRERPWVAFSGNLQGRHARETGPKGAFVVSVVDGRVTTVEPRVLDVVRWCALEVDVSDAAGGYDATDRVVLALQSEVQRADERPLAARITLVGSSPAHDAFVSDPERWIAAVRAAASDVGDLWVEKVELRTTRSVELAQLASGDDALGQVARRLLVLREDPIAREELMAELADFTRKLPAEVRAALALDDDQMRRELVDGVAHLLLSRLGRLEESE